MRSSENKLVVCLLNHLCYKVLKTFILLNSRNTLTILFAWFIYLANPLLAWQTRVKTAARPRVTPGRGVCSQGACCCATHVDRHWSLSLGRGASHLSPHWISSASCYHWSTNSPCWKEPLNIFKGKEQLKSNEWLSFYIAKAYLTQKSRPWWSDPLIDLG